MLSRDTHNGGFGRRQKALTSRGRGAGGLLLRQTIALVALVLTGCAGAQSTPDRTLTAFYGAIEDQEYSDACEMIEPELRRALVAVSGPCSIMIAEEWGDLRDVEVDESAITTTGDVARVPAGAITSGGKPVDDEGLTLARINDEWYISGGG